MSLEQVPVTPWREQVLLALLSGVWLSAFLLNQLDPARALLRTVDEYWTGAVIQSGHVGVVRSCVPYGLALDTLLGLMRIADLVHILPWGLYWGCVSYGRDTRTGARCYQVCLHALPREAVYALYGYGVDSRGVAAR